MLCNLYMRCSRTWLESDVTKSSCIVRFWIHLLTLSMNYVSSLCIFRQTLFQLKQTKTIHSPVNAPVCPRPIEAARLTTSERANKNSHETRQTRMITVRWWCVVWSGVKCSFQSTLLLTQTRKVTLFCLCIHRWHCLCVCVPEFLYILCISTRKEELLIELSCACVCRMCSQGM